MRSVKLDPPSFLDLSESMIVESDVRRALARLPSCSVQCVVTSPPYWGLRDYGIAGQIGLENTMAGFIQSLTTVFAEVKRVLKANGIMWLNIGDGYTSGNRGWRAPDKKNPNRAMSVRPDNPPGLKDKDLLGIPWRLAFALQDSGWFLRSDIVWHKPNAMPESVKDRPTRAHEYLFMFSKEQSYQYYDEPVKELAEDGSKRNRRTVWSINTTSSGGSHIAAFPQALVEPCILASTQRGDFVLDPFFGSGTVGLVAAKLGRRYIGIELNPHYVAEAKCVLQPSTTFIRTNGSPHSDQPHESDFALNETPGDSGYGFGSISKTVSATSSLRNNKDPRNSGSKRGVGRVRAGRRSKAVGKSGNSR
jgi:site-specific DNA-methyltransferase (cytosine-N4-specific)